MLASRDMSGYPIELMTFMTHSSKLGTAVVVSDPWSCMVNCFLGVSRFLCSVVI